MRGVQGPAHQRSGKTDALPLRCSRLSDGRAIEVNEMLLRSDAYELVYEVPAQ